VRQAAADPSPFGVQLDRSVTASFLQFLQVIEQTGPDKLQEEADALAAKGDDSHFDVLAAFWRQDAAALPSPTDEFLARAFLQPFAVAIRERTNLRYKGPIAYICPFCMRKPCVGALRPLGDGGQRSLICSFCLAEWEFRRIVCPGCGAEDPAKLPVYSAEELPHMRVEACDSCKSYIKTADLTRSALGHPVVDEIAAVALDLWAQMKGYTKLQANLLQL